jgi:hypothetical protein
MEIDENAPGNKSQQPETRMTDNETGHDPERDAPEVPLPTDDEAPVDEDLADVQANRSMSNEYPETGTDSRADDPDAARMNELDDDEREQRNVPASDPESGA